MPRDITLCGFENDQSRSIMYPDLTSIDSRVLYVGKLAMHQLAWRIANPDAPFEVVKITSNILYRYSTEGSLFK